MTANDGYRELFLNDTLPERAVWLEASIAAQAEWDVLTSAESKRLKLKKKASLPQDFVDALRVVIFEKYRLDEIEAASDAANDAYLARLDEIAGSMEFSPTDDAWHLVEKTDTGSYRSMGYNASRYARACLAPLQEKLASLGFQTHIRRTDSWLNDWELWADCEPWMADAATKLITIGDWKECHAISGVNTLVYNPFA